ncbi:hypothetical protein Dsin_014475 [Dipteronia sinensis]|uniref:C2H2-type domain-containing protein n=1 Tax=Dipteronia sinensis TaxID=43782 RepID=A0AAE0AML4_9ROSI|nr:hypothetical protein Dsin_014475 [Dipteronia sinensis]
MMKDLIFHQQQQQQQALEENMSNLTSASGEASASYNSHQAPALEAQPPPAKKKRNLPGNPDPDAEVISLSPKTLMATNRFLCEICNKGFQRDQNLQLHRRGHNLPWKLKQRSKLEVIRKKVYVCPETTCVHHDPSRALGDLTGIKKHFSRKHGEKKWKCDKCSKKYAVQSDWKAHSKTCGTREYRCDCGTLFSRRDSFITHRAFCDALAEESARAIPNNNSNNVSSDHHYHHQNQNQFQVPQFNHQDHLHGFSLKKEQHQQNFSLVPPWLASQPMLGVSGGGLPSSSQGLDHHHQYHHLSSSSSSSPSIFNTRLDHHHQEFLTNPNHSLGPTLLPPPPPPPFHHHQTAVSSPSPSSLSSSSPHMSATALLQKAAQMGATMSSNAPDHHHPALSMIRPHHQQQQQQQAHVSSASSAAAEDSSAHNLTTSSTTTRPTGFGLNLSSRDQGLTQPSSSGVGGGFGSSSSALLQEMMMMNPNSSIFDDTFGGNLMINSSSTSKKLDGINNNLHNEFSKTRNDENNGGGHGGGGGGGEGLTRDFLGLRALSHSDILSIAGLGNCMNTTSHEQQSHQKPWQG